MPRLAGGEDGEYVLRVRGDSMIDAGILEGDFVVVRPQEVARTARSSLRSWVRRRPSSASSRRRTTYACSPRTELEPIRSKDVQVLGSVVGLFRSVR